MTSTLRAPVLVPGLATGIGSLPHTDARDAAEVVLRCLPDFPAAPQLPARDPREGCSRNGSARLPEVEVAADGSFALARHVRPRARCVFDEPRPRRAARVPRRRERARTRTGARQGSGHRALDARVSRCSPRAFRSSARSGAPQRSPRVVGGDRGAVRTLVCRRHPVVLFFDEPALVAWRRGNAPLDRESAIDVLSGALAAVDCVTGVHVCGDGDLGLALESGPQVLGVEVSEALVRDAIGAAVASSTATVGLRGARFPPTGRSANRPTSTGVDWRWSGASSRVAGAIPCRSARGHDHPGLRARGLWCLASRAGARHRRRARRSRARPGRCGPPHAGSLTLEPTSYRYCGVCGQPLEAGATVCGNCGAAVDPPRTTR